MKPLMTAFLFALSADAAFAHVDHLAEVAGHGHWLGAAALGAAIALGAWGAMKGKKEEASDAEEADLENEELQEA